jgi:virginiamycin A acetyltransferase
VHQYWPSLRLRDLLPGPIRTWIRLTRLRRAFPGTLFSSPEVDRRASFEPGSAVGVRAYVGQHVKLGAHSYINVGAIVASGTIGRFCSIGHYALIGLENHPLNHLSTSPYLYQGRLFGPEWSADFDEMPSPPTIGNDVWVGAGAVVLQGVVIGDGAVIAAGAVVTGDVQPYAIVAGVPARLIRYRFDDETVSRLRASAWWDLPIESVRELYGDAIRSGEGWTQLHEERRPAED